MKGLNTIVRSGYVGLVTAACFEAQAALHFAPAWAARPTGRGALAQGTGGLTR